MIGISEKIDFLQPTPPLNAYAKLVVNVSETICRKPAGNTNRFSAYGVAAG